MVRLNRNTLNEKQHNDLFQQFARTVSPVDSDHADTVLSELLGTEERVMVAKRLAVIVLLVEGTSMYKIGQLLKLSQSTVEHISQKFEKGHYDHTLQYISKTEKDYFAFLDILDNILHLGGVLPHYNGLDRYRSLR